MRVAQVGDFKARLSKFLAMAQREGAVVVTRHGRPAAIVVRPPDDPDDLERLLLAHNRRFQAVIRKSLKSRLVPEEEFRRIVAQMPEARKPRSRARKRKPKPKTSRGKK